MNLGVSHDLYRDTLEITVTGNDTMYFALMYLDNDSGDFIASEDIEVGCSASTFQTAIAGYYNDKFGTAPSVTKTDTDQCTNQYEAGVACNTLYCVDDTETYVDCDVEECFDIYNDFPLFDFI